MLQKIINFHQDNKDHWVADLKCGHSQHTRHHPPIFNRDWVLTVEGRSLRIGTELDCKVCEEEDNFLSCLGSKV